MIVDADQFGVPAVGRDVRVDIAVEDGHHPPGKRAVELAATRGVRTARVLGGCTAVLAHRQQRQRSQGGRLVRIQDAEPGDRRAVAPVDRRTANAFDAVAGHDDDEVIHMLDAVAGLGSRDRFKRQRDGVLAGVGTGHRDGQRRISQISRGVAKPADPLQGRLGDGQQGVVVHAPTIAPWTACS